ncbi:MAG: hypothetical protein K6T88_12860 [Bacillus sp. (in: Bacteria)]|nr:hypothetical protein [Bacillus sp. (in: firmicutes)]
MRSIARKVRKKWSTRSIRTVHKPEKRKKWSTRSIRTVYKTEKRKKWSTRSIRTVYKLEKRKKWLLQTYKEQEEAETRFHLLKSPQMIDGFVLKKSRRIEALGIVFVMSLLIYCILEQRVHQQAGQWPRFIPDNMGEQSKRILQQAGYDLSIYVSKVAEKQLN